MQAGHVYFEEYGSGQPMVLLHGHTLDRSMWDECRSRLVAHFRLILPDLAGHGRTGLPPEGQTLADDVALVLRTRGLERAWICGLSLGGAAAVNFALQYPEQCEALIPVDAAVFGCQMAQWPGARPYIKQARLEGLGLALEAWLADPLFAPAMASPASDRIRAMVRAFPGQTWTGSMPTMSAPGQPDAERLHQIKAPTLVVVGEHDLPDFQQVSDLLAQSIPGARKVVIAGAGHLSPLEKPQAFAKAVLAFHQQLLGA